MSWLIRLRADWPGSFLRPLAGETGFLKKPHSPPATLVANFWRTNLTTPVASCKNPHDRRIGMGDAYPMRCTTSQGAGPASPIQLD